VHSREVKGLRSEDLSYIKNGAKLGASQNLGSVGATASCVRLLRRRGSWRGMCTWLGFLAARFW